MKRKRARTASLAQRDSTMCSPPVSSVVSPKHSVLPIVCSLSKALPTVGLAPQPLVVSLSPHLVLTQSSCSAQGSRCFSLAHCRYSRAARLAFRIVWWSPCSSMPKPVTGLPLAAMPSTTRRVQPSSMPMTTTAATFGLLPVPIRVRKCSSRSAPNCSRPYGCGIASVPGMARHGLGGGVGQVVDGQDQDVVAHADAAVLAPVAQESGVRVDQGHGLTSAWS
ncbi:hypothetical protein IWX58_004078 [Rubrivivax gelatinosus]|nr:hypothetical protein [Rubrivivax gelatinosus]